MVSFVHEPALRGLGEYHRLLKQHHRVVIASLAPHVVRTGKAMAEAAKESIPIMWFLDVMPWTPLASIADPQPRLPCGRMRRRARVLKPQCMDGFVSQVRRRQARGPSAVHAACSTVSCCNLCFCLSSTPVRMACVACTSPRHMCHGKG